MPQPIYSDRHDLANEKALAVGVPVYIGGIGAGLAIVASGGTLAFAALITAAGAAVGAGIGGMLAHSTGTHHAKDLEEQLKMGALLRMEGRSSLHAAEAEIRKNERELRRCST